MQLTSLRTVGLRPQKHRSCRPTPAYRVYRSSQTCCSLIGDESKSVSTSSWTPFGWELNKKFDSRRAKIDGLTAHYLVAGKGRTVIVLIASMVVLARSYRTTLNVLARDHTVFCLELPGCGRSDCVQKPFSSEQYADWIVSFLEQVGIPKAVVIGHSCSTAPALALAESRPDLMSHLVLVSAIGMAPPDVLLQLTAGGTCKHLAVGIPVKHCEPATGGHAPRGLEKIVLGRLRGALLEVQFSIPGAFHGLYNILFQANSFWFWIGMTTSLDMTPTAARVEVPTLLGWGRHDYTCPVAAGHKYNRAIPRSLMYISEHGSHNWLIQNPEEFVANVSSFIGKQESAAAA